MSYPTTQSQKRLKSFLTEISSRGIPEKITQKYLESVGYKSKNDRALVPILKHINFLNQNGTPTENYSTFRDETKSRQVMGTVLKESYSDLYREFPNAHLEDNSKLSNWFKTQMGSSDVVGDRATAAFKALVGFADFDGVAPTRKEEPKKEITEKVVEVSKEGLVINVNIQLTLPATENVEVYDRIFKSLKENILK